MSCSSPCPPAPISLNFEDDMEFITLTPSPTPRQHSSSTSSSSSLDEKFVTVHVSTAMLVDTTYVSVTPISSSTPSQIPTTTTSTNSTTTSTSTSHPILSTTSKSPAPAVRHVTPPVWNQGKSYAQVLREALDTDFDAPTLVPSTSPKMRVQQRVKAR